MLDTSGKTVGQNPSDLKFQIAFPPGNEAAVRNTLSASENHHPFTLARAGHRSSP